MDEFMPKALPVAFEKYKGDDGGNPATSAEEYLSRVRQEAKQCPDVVVAEVQAGQSGPHLEFLQTEDQVESTLPWNTPTRKWQLEQSDEYTKVRLSLSTLQERVPKKSRKSVLQCYCCCGEDTPRIFMEDAVDESRTHLHTDGSPRPPLVTILLNMDQPMVQQVLDYHIHWLQLMGFTIAQGCWIYALMACLAKPLIPDSAASIRIMARTCRNIRLTVESEEDDRLSSLNLLIALVANCFDQET